MKVARSFALDDVRIEEIDDPVPGPGEVVCDVLACGVCASDVTDWYVAKKFPAVLGHEPAGVIRALGEGVNHVSVGDRVAIHHHAPCGECRRCRRGHETMCERFRATQLDPGGFAETVRIPPELVDELLTLPDELDPVAATFIEPLACVLRALDRAGARAGDSLLVVGAGVNGLLTIAAAHARAVDVVWVREPRAGATRRRRSTTTPSATATSSWTSRSCARPSPTRSPMPSPPWPRAGPSASTRRRHRTLRRSSTPPSCSSMS